MSVQEQIGQMSQIDLQLLLNHKDETNPHQNGDDDVTLNRTKLEYYIGTLGIGSGLNNVVEHAWLVAPGHGLAPNIRSGNEPRDNC